MIDLSLPKSWKAQDVDFSRTYANQTTNWQVDQAKKTVTHIGTQPDPQRGFPLGVFTFSERLINGEFSAKLVVREDYADFHGALIFRCLAQRDRYYAFGIGGWNLDNSLLIRSVNGIYLWSGSGIADKKLKFAKGSEFSLSVRLLGSRVDCLINGARIFSELLPPQVRYQTGNIGFYAYGESKFEMSDIQLRRAPLICFFVSPINKAYDASRFKKLKRSIEHLRIDGHCPLKCFRADDSHKSEPFIRTIIETMKNANITVVDVPAEQNENVFYEMGIAHALNLPTVIRADKIARILADLRHLNILLDDNRLLASIKEILERDEYYQVSVP